MSIDARLIEERERLHMTQAEFAQIGGVSTRSQVYYESGNRYPDASYLAAIASIGVDVQYILTGERSLKISDVHFFDEWQELSITERAAMEAAIHVLVTSKRVRNESVNSY